MKLMEQELRLASSALTPELNRLELSVPTIHCGGCIRKIETAISSLDKVHLARVNLSTKRLSVQWREVDGPPNNLIKTLSNLGFEAHLGSPVQNDRSDKTLKHLYKALAVAAFAAMNIMMMSVAVWAGAPEPSRQLFHWISALIAFPALAYSGKLFFSSAWFALRAKQTNMDVPISIGLILTFTMSLFDTVAKRSDVYFDAAISLLFFLLIGRTLDYLMRKRARTAVDGLLQMSPRGAAVLDGNGESTFVRLDEIQPGMLFIVPVGERVAVDGIIEQGTSNLDMSLISGETILKAVTPGLAVVSGVLNVTQPLTIKATASANMSFMADMMRLMGIAEQSKGHYRQLADRISSYYAPVVHSAALLTLIAWFVISGSFHHALTIAITVLIITCPCALALAIPMVQIIASKRLFESGILMKSGSALERINQIDHIVFDKTGTLTFGTPSLSNKDEIRKQYLNIAASLAVFSSHPQCLTLQKFQEGQHTKFDNVSEIPGKGLIGQIDENTYQLGQRNWAFGTESDIRETETVLCYNGELLAEFKFDDQIRPESKAVISHLKMRKLGIDIISGDAPEKVSSLAAKIGIKHCLGGIAPQEKMAHIEALISSGKRPLMIGDGINDAPALAIAHTSMAPGSAADIGRTSADFVFLNGDLSAVPITLRTAKNSKSLIQQNIAFAIIYNLIAIPIACLGLITPIIAAIAMSTSSLIVIGNSMRLNHETSLSPEVRP